MLQPIENRNGNQPPNQEAVMMINTIWPHPGRNVG